jgi:hypothetical protein
MTKELALDYGFLQCQPWGPMYAKHEKKWKKKDAYVYIRR